jgi:hypothetical protein
LKAKERSHVSTGDGHADCAAIGVSGDRSMFFNVRAMRMEQEGSQFGTKVGGIAS